MASPGALACAPVHKACALVHNRVLPTLLFAGAQQGPSSIIFLLVFLRVGEKRYGS